MLGVNDQLAALVCDEFPVQLELNGASVVTLLCTPQDLTELAVGWLYCEGLIARVDDLLAVGACDELGRMRVFAEGNRPLVQSEWRRVITIPSVTDCTSTAIDTTMTRLPRGTVTSLAAVATP